MGTAAPSRRQAAKNGRAAARRVARSRAVRIGARAGFVVRAAFYLLLAGLVARTAYDGGTAGPQANSNGALSVIAESVLGKVAIGAAALGFLLLGVERVAAAIRDRGANGRSRAKTALQGVFYLALTWAPLSFLLGNSQTGSEQSQHRATGSVLSWPAGREIVGAVGVVVLVVCGAQLWSAMKQEFTAGLSLGRAPRWVRVFAEAAGTVGIATRGVVFMPIGVFLIVAAVQSDPQHAKGLDAELATMARQSWWGPAALGLVALGLLVLAAYSGVEARYRRVARSS